MPPFSFAPASAPNISFGNVAGDTGQAISSVLGGVRQQQQLQQENAMKAALLQNAQNRELDTRELIEQGRIPNLQAGTSRTNEGTDILQTDVNRLNSREPTLTTSGATSTGSPGALPANRDEVQRKHLEDDVRNIVNERAAWSKNPVNNTTPYDEHLATGWQHQYPAEAQREMQTRRQLAALYARHPEWGPQPQQEPAGLSGPSQPGTAHGAPPTSPASGGAGSPNGPALDQTPRPDARLERLQSLVDSIHQAHPNLAPEVVKTMARAQLGQ